MKLVYIAGPYRAATPWKVEQNIRRAEEVAILVARAGAMPVVPHTMTRHWNGCADDEFWLDGTLELMRRCDGVALVPGWISSSGTKVEKAEAEKLGLPVIDCELNGETALREWVGELRLPEARLKPKCPDPCRYEDSSVCGGCEELCGAISNTKLFRCTKPKGHSGNHKDIENNMTFELLPNQYTEPKPWQR